MDIKKSLDKIEPDEKAENRVQRLVEERTRTKVRGSRNIQWLTVSLAACVLLAAGIIFLPGLLAEEKELEYGVWQLNTAIITIDSFDKLNERSGSVVAGRVLSAKLPDMMFDSNEDRTIDNGNGTMSAWAVQPTVYTVEVTEVYKGLTLSWGDTFEIPHFRYTNNVNLADSDEEYVFFLETLYTPQGAEYQAQSVFERESLKWVMGYDVEVSHVSLDWLRERYFSELMDSQWRAIEAAELISDNMEHFAGKWLKGDKLHIAITCDSPETWSVYMTKLQGYEDIVIFELAKYTYKQLQRIQRIVGDELQSAGFVWNACGPSESKNQVSFGFSDVEEKRELIEAFLLDLIESHELLTDMEVGMDAFYLEEMGQIVLTGLH